MTINFTTDTSHLQTTTAVSVDLFILVLSKKKVTNISSILADSVLSSKIPIVGKEYWYSYLSMIGCQNNLIRKKKYWIEILYEMIQEASTHLTTLFQLYSRRRLRSFLQIFLRIWPFVLLYHWLSARQSIIQYPSLQWSMQCGDHIHIPDCPTKKCPVSRPMTKITHPHTSNVP